MPNVLVLGRALPVVCPKPESLNPKPGAIRNAGPCKLGVAKSSVPSAEAFGNSTGAPIIRVGFWGIWYIILSL